MADARSKRPHLPQSVSVARFGGRTVKHQVGPKCQACLGIGP
jgi:hypothetical protein